MNNGPLLSLGKFISYLIVFASLLKQKQVNRFFNVLDWHFDVVDPLLDKCVTAIY
jgi:hypothetical protein